MHVAYLHYSAHYVFTETKNDIYKHCSSLAGSTCLTWSVLPTAEVAPMQELLNSTEQKVSGGEKGDEESIKKKRVRYNSMYYSASIKLTIASG
uniref:Uncharacterized protein n=1 Tax=Rhipicephalus zambeziensis TaxID=60191 RepID=A0A224YKW0_9ACAR